MATQKTVGTLGSTCHPVFCAQLQEVAFLRAFGQGTLPAQAFPLRVGKETFRDQLQLTTKMPNWWPPSGTIYRLDLLSPGKL